MARLRKSSAVLETARRRLAGLKSIKTPPDFGPGLTAAAYDTQIGVVATKLDAYNQLLASADDLLNDLQAEEGRLNELNRRFLSSAEGHFGPDSSEYEMMGGTRKSERKKPKSKKDGGSTPPPTP